MAGNSIDILNKWLSSVDLLFKADDDNLFKEQIKYDEQKLFINKNRLEKFVTNFKSEHKLDFEISPFQLLQKNVSCFQNLYHFLTINENFQTCSIFEALSTSSLIDISQKRVSKWLMTKIVHFCDIGVLKNFNTSPTDDTLVLTIENHESLLENVSENVLKRLASNHCTILQIDGKFLSTLLSVLHFVHLLYKSGFSHELVSIQLRQYQAPSRLKTLAIRSVPIAVVFDNCDVDSTIERILSLMIEKPSFDKRLDLWIQQSIADLFYKKFKESYDKFFKASSEHSQSLSHIFYLKSSDQFNPSNLFDINFLGCSPHNEISIKVHLFKNHTDLTLTLSRYAFIQFMTIWSENVSFAIEFAQLFDNCGLFWINTILEFNPSIGFFNPIFGNVSDFYTFNISYYLDLEETAIISDEAILNRSNEAFNNLKKMTTISRLASINKLILFFGENFSNQLYFILNSLDQTLNELITLKVSNGCYVVINMKPIGTVIFRDLDQLEDEKMQNMINVILITLLTGNCVILEYQYKINEIMKNFQTMINKFLPKFSLQILKSDKDGKQNEINLKNLKVENLLNLNKSIWLKLISDLTNVKSLLLLITKYQTIWFPVCGSIGIDM